MYLLLNVVYVSIPVVFQTYFRYSKRDTVSDLYADFRAIELCRRRRGRGRSIYKTNTLRAVAIRPRCLLYYITLNLSSNYAIILYRI